MARFEIRPATERDFEAICNVHIASIFGQGRVSYTHEQCESWAAGIRPDLYKASVNDGEMFEVAINNAERVIAFSSVKENELMALYIEPEWARRGVGTALLGRAEELIKSNGFGSVQLSASLNGYPFYRSKGYREQSRKMWTSRGGIDLEIIILEKELSD